VLDFDGTLVRSAVDFPALRRAVVDESVRSGVPPSIWSEGDGTTAMILKSFDYLRERSGEAARAGFEARVSKSMADVEVRAVPRTRAVDGAHAALAELRSMGLRTAVLTRGSRRYAESGLAQAGLSGFDAIVCRDDGPEEEAKPSGEAMRRVARALNVAASECLMVGDHSIDLECARNSSARFVGVLSGAFTRADWDACGCRDVVGSIAELPNLLRN